MRAGGGGATPNHTGRFLELSKHI
ncbi:hypothetical protein MTBLM5_220039 [Magnetospirillum sp. LM-5]|nr:hypothetical protein MTBLM5_220039 [Magnetospirillum sp. LM-5]